MQTFRDFMEASLYSPNGYYPTREAKADFYTAPELHPAFAEILASEAASRSVTAANSSLAARPRSSAWAISLSALPCCASSSSNRSSLK